MVQKCYPLFYANGWRFLRYRPNELFSFSILNCSTIQRSVLQKCSSLCSTVSRLAMIMKMMKMIEFDVERFRPIDLNIKKFDHRHARFDVLYEEKKKGKMKKIFIYSIPGFVSIIASHLLFFVIYNDHLGVSAASSAIEVEENLPFSFFYTHTSTRTSNVLTNRHQHHQ